MVLAGDSLEAWTEARRELAARSADLADADRALARTLAGAYAVAVESINRIDTIASAVESAVLGEPKDSPTGARELSRHLVAQNREIAEAIREAQAAVDAKTVVLQELIARYRTQPLR